MESLIRQRSCLIVVSRMETRLLFRWGSLPRTLLANPSSQKSECRPVEGFSLPGQFAISRSLQERFQPSDCTGFSEIWKGFGPPVCRRKAKRKGEPQANFFQAVGSNMLMSVAVQPES